MDFKIVRKKGNGAIEIDYPPNFHERGEWGRLELIPPQTAKNVRKGARSGRDWNRLATKKIKCLKGGLPQKHFGAWPTLASDCPGLPQVALDYTLT